LARVVSESWSLPGYDVQTLIGSGTTGEVWRAREVATGDTVALQRLGEDTEQGALEALSRTAVLLRDLDTPYVVRLRAVVGRVLVLDDAPGGSLAGLLARRGRLTAGEVVTVAAPLAAALASAHALGVVHGDLSPSSVLFTAAGMPLLADLGVARATGRPAGGRTAADYADPAVGAGRDPDAAADVWALAAVCHHLLAGMPPQDADAAQEGDAVRRVAVLDPAPTGQRVPTGQLVPATPRALVAAVEAVLMAAPAQRPDAAEFASLLRRAHVTAPVRLTGGPGPEAESGEPATAASVVRASPQGSRPGRGSGSERGRSWGQARTRARARARARAVPGWARMRARTPVPGQARGSVRVRVWGPVSRRTVPAAGLALLVVLAAVLGWMSGRGDVPLAAALTPLPVPPASTGATPPAPDSTALPSTRAGSPILASPPAAPDWPAVLDGLDAARAAAFATVDQRALSAVWASGSPGLAADTTAVQDLAQDGHTAHGLRHAVQAVEVLAVDETATTGAVARLRIIDVLAEHEIHDAAGGVVRREAARGATDWIVELVQTPAGWRLASVTAA